MRSEVSHWTESGISTGTFHPVQAVGAQLFTIWIKGKKRSSGFLCIFTEASLLFLTPAGGSNPAEH